MRLPNRFPLTRFLDEMFPKTISLARLVTLMQNYKTVILEQITWYHKSAIYNPVCFIMWHGFSIINRRDTSLSN